MSLDVYIAGPNDSMDGALRYLEQLEEMKKLLLCGGVQPPDSRNVSAMAKDHRRAYPVAGHGLLSDRRSYNVGRQPGRRVRRLGRRAGDWRSGGAPVRSGTAH
jgi:hypothetical protein